jgi:two-component system sensor histidine kinase UhpB
MVTVETKVEEYRAVFLSAPDGILVVGSDGRIQDLNPQTEAMFGYRREELLGQEIEILVPKESREIHRGERAGYTEDAHVRPMGIGLQLTGRRKDGSEFPVEICLSPMNGGEGASVIAMVRDVTERNRLRAFGVSALRAAEDERQRIARELHDDTAQRLAALLVRLRVLGRTEDGEERDRQLEEVRDEIQESAESVRRIARGLRPPILDEGGVIGAIRSHLKDLEEAYAIDMQLAVPNAPPRLNSDSELALYRIVQEAMANVVRHAGASFARVEVTAVNGRVVATVEDDGRGFDPTTSIQKGRGLGLVGMRERARNAGGQLMIDSEPGKGTRIQVDMPIREGFSG